MFKSRRLFNYPTIKYALLQLTETYYATGYKRVLISNALPQHFKDIEKGILYLALDTNKKIVYAQSTDMKLPEELYSSTYEKLHNLLKEYKLSNKLPQEIVTPELVDKIISQCGYNLSSKLDSRFYYSLKGSLTPSAICLLRHYPFPASIIAKIIKKIMADGLIPLHQQYLLAYARKRGKTYYEAVCSELKNTSELKNIRRLPKPLRPSEASRFLQSTFKEWEEEAYRALSGWELPIHQIQEVIPFAVREVYGQNLFSEWNVNATRYVWWKALASVTVTKYILRTSTDIADKKHLKLIPLLNREFAEDYQLFKQIADNDLKLPLSVQAEIAMGIEAAAGAQFKEPISEAIQLYTILSVSLPTLLLLIILEYMPITHCLLTANTLPFWAAMQKRSPHAAKGGNIYRLRAPHPSTPIPPPQTDQGFFASIARWFSGS